MSVYQVVLVLGPYITGRYWCRFPSQCGRKTGQLLPVTGISTGTIIAPIVNHPSFIFQFASIMYRYQHPHGFLQKTIKTIASFETAHQQTYYLGLVRLPMGDLCEIGHLNYGSYLLCGSLTVLASALYSLPYFHPQQSAILYLCADDTQQFMSFRPSQYSTSFSRLNQFLHYSSWMSNQPPL